MIAVPKNVANDPVLKGRFSNALCDVASAFQDLSVDPFLSGDQQIEGTDDSRGNSGLENGHVCRRLCGF